MPKEFYTERDIEDLFKRGSLSLQINDNVVLTELAYEKAKGLGMQLVRERPVEAPFEPPVVPVRPYISQFQKPAAGVVPPPAVAETDLPACIREAVNARLGTQVDPALLDVIIQRVLKSTGMK